MTGHQMIEEKLENGVQVFPASDVAHLLNEIRIYKHILKQKREEAKRKEKKEGK
ncbi:hypothetical protein [Bacillus altitudinis]|uniref:hypothetical protein n=1 Tax=Bacillus altitudinis TaxID=293387 RepID=UPI002101B234|nr:hypothetical protein [Bacillus altitudinis]UTV34863.1 hypothetical protein NM966_19915 [Bacillus altitudinis]